MYTWVSNEYSNEYANKSPHHMITYILKGVLTKKSLDSRYLSLLLEDASCPGDQGPAVGTIS